MTTKQELLDRAKEHAVGPDRDDEWGEKIDSLEDTDDTFFGRFRGEAEDENYEGHGRRIFLFWTEENELVWYRGKWGLNLEMDRVRPEIGSTIAIYVGDAWSGKDGNSGFYFGVESEPSADPLPEDAPAAVASDDDIPF